MPFLTLGASTELQIKVPTNGTTDWGDTLKTDTFQKIAEHDHTGSGKGKQLGTGSLQANAVNGTKFRLQNNEYLRARDNANSTDINILKINTSDDLEFAPDIAILNLKNDSFVTARNQADSGNVDILKLDASDNIILNLTQVNAVSSATLTDATGSATDAEVITLSADETCKIQGKITRNGLVRRVEIELDQDNANIIESGHGDDVGVTFSIASDQLQYTTTSTGFDATFTYTIIKE
jgi:hypothetical protein